MSTMIAGTSTSFSVRLGLAVLVTSFFLVHQSQAYHRSFHSEGKSHRSTLLRPTENHDTYSKNSVKDKHFNPVAHHHRSPEEEVECHEAALWRCGHVFMKMFKMLHFLNEDDAFEPKCALRSTFFSCLKSLKSKPCRKHRMIHKDRFRKKLADTIWATRNCLVGLH